MRYVSLTVPVTVATAFISSAADWQQYIVLKSAEQSIDGYFILTESFSASDIGTKLKPSVNGETVLGFIGTLDGRGKTITIESGTDTGLGIFGVLGKGALVKNLTITDNSGIAPNWTTGITLAQIAAKATLQNVTIDINNANHTNGTRYGALTHEGIVGCKFIGVTVNISGAVQSLSGGGNDVLGLSNTEFTDCSINLLTDDSRLDEVGHNGSGVYVAQGAAAINGETKITGITIKKAGSGANLVSDGTSVYSIIKPSNSSATIDKAAAELVKYFKEATGYTLAVTDDSSNISHGVYQTYVSLGNTSLLVSAGITAPDVKTNGAYIYTKDCNIYIKGGSDKGVLYGVYELLSDLFGLEFYSADCYTIDSGISDMIRPDFDKTYNPTVNLRGQTGIVLGEDEIFVDYSNHIRSTDYVWAYLMPIINAAEETKTDYGHNSLYYLPGGMYRTAHPNFYSDNSTWTTNSWGGTNAQLCFTAHGNETEYNTMVSLCAERIEASLVKYADNKVYDSVMLGIEDNYLMCDCAACTAVKNTYGAISATVILFLDDVATQVETWMNANAQYKRDLQYMFFAYQQCLQAPDTMPSVTNKIAPLVAMSEMDYSATPTDSAVRTTSAGSVSNAAVLGYAEQWGAFAVGNGAKAWAWTYGNFYRDYFCFYDSYSFYAEIFSYLGDYGFDLVYVQQQSAQRNVYTAFYSLNQYVTSKLADDATLSMDALIDDYMNAMYKEAAVYMKSLFDAWRATFTERGLNSKSLGYETPGAELSVAHVRKMLGYLENAYSAIAAYETSDPELYAVVKARIDAEWLSPAKIALVDLKAYFSSESDYDELKTKFVALVEETGITAASEFNKDMTAILNAI